MKSVASVLSSMLFAVLLTMGFSSCATMFTGTKADIFIDGDVNEPVTISSSAGVYKDVSLPTFVEVKRRHLNGQHIQINSDHHAFEDIVLEKDFNGWALASAVSGITPFLIDLMTNAVSKPKFDQFFIIPKDGLTTAGTLHGKRPTVQASTMSSETKATLREKRLPVKFPRHEFNATLGFGPNQADRFTKRFVDDFIQSMHMEVEGECGDIFGNSYVVGKLEYHYRLNRKWDIGAFVAWAGSSEGYTDEHDDAMEEHQQDNPGTITYGYSKGRGFSLAPSVRYTWYETRNCRLFSRVSLGMMRHHLKFDIEEMKYGNITKRLGVGSTIREDSFEKTKWRMAYQFSPIGINVGTGPLRFFAEIGYGCLGVCNVGLGFCF